MGIDGSEIKRKRELKEKKEAEALSSTNQAEPPPLTHNKKLPTIRHKLVATLGFFVGCICCLVVIAIVLKLFESSPSQPSSYAIAPDDQIFDEAVKQASISTRVVIAINGAYGNVCHAEVTGFFSKTLKIDWTSNTNKFHAIKVMAEIGSVKEKLYEDGVRYFQFPNDAGTYNVVDWKTGDKESISDTARYYFPD
jgi:hypothetical protein